MIVQAWEVWLDGGGQREKIRWRCECGYKTSPIPTVWFPKLGSTKCPTCNHVWSQLTNAAEIIHSAQYPASSVYGSLDKPLKKNSHSACTTCNRHR